MLLCSTWFLQPSASISVIYTIQNTKTTTSAYLQFPPVSWSEVIGGTATPVHDVFVLTLASQLPLPVGDVQVVVSEALAELRVAKDSVEEGLEEIKNN